jgi:GT2 family glycosyltransferase
LNREPLVAVLVLHWNSVSDTLACLRALDASTYARRTVIVIDNGSMGGADEIARSRPDTTLLRLERNMGYAGGNNEGIAYAQNLGADYVLLLNDDTEVEPSTIHSLVEAALADPGAGLLGPKVLVADTVARQGTPVLLAAGGVVPPNLDSRLRGTGERDTGQYDSGENVDFLSGCALMASRDLIEEVGALDPAFFTYREEVDWAIRARAAGFGVLYVPRARAWHPDTRARDSASAAVTYYMTKNHLLLARKHGPKRLVWALRASYARRALSWTVRPVWRDRRPLVRPLVSALVADAFERRR